MLPPKRFKSTEDRDSQETRATSTPQNASPLSLCSPPSISTITREDVPMEVDSDSEDELGSGSTAEGDISSTFFEVSMRNDSEGNKTPVKSVKWEGYWRTYKPKNPDSLYYKIMAQPAEIESIAIDVVNIYKEDPKTGTFIILQLFVDLAGYKNLSIETIYNFEQPNSERAINLMETELLEKELKNGQFLLQKTTKFGEDIQNIVSQFLYYLFIQCVKKEVLFNEIFLQHVTEFVRFMSFSIGRPIRGTGAFLVMYLSTIFVNLHQQHLALVQNCNGGRREKELLETKISVIESHIDYLYHSFESNCLLPEERWTSIKLRAVKEMYKWITTYPHTFIIKRRCLGYLTKLILDKSKQVRLAAVSTCEKLVSSEKISSVLIDRIELCLKCVSKRLVDVNSKVAIKATNVFIAAVKRYPDKVTREYKVIITTNIYYEDVSVGKASGKFLVTYLRSRHKDTQNFLTALVKFAFWKEYRDKIPIFLESVIDYAPELEQWTNFIKILLNDTIPFKTRVQLVKIFNETVRYVLTGNFSSARKRGPAKSKNDDHMEIATILIPNFKRLLIRFQDSIESLQELIEVLSFIKYDACQLYNLDEHFTEVLSLLKDLFQQTSDQKLLQIITNTLATFSEQGDYAQATTVIEDIINTIVNSLSNELKQMSPNCDKSVLIQVRQNSYKASILFSKFNLTTVLRWDEIFQIWGKGFLKTAKYLIVCAKWHLIWSLRQFIQQSNNDNNDIVPTNQLLYNNCKEFVYGCLNMLKHGERNSESFMILESLGDLYISFDKELIRKRQYSHFVIEINEPTSLDILFNFSVHHVVENKDLELIQRRSLLAKVVSFLYLDVVPAEYFPRILRYYNSHQEEFDRIFEDAIKQLNSVNPTLPLVVLHTLVQIYNEILQKHGVVDIRSEDSNYLKNLAKKFSAIKELKSNDVALKLIQMCIGFALRNQRNYNFLYFSKYFATHLNEEGKSDARDYLKSLVPKKHKQNEIFTYFAKALK